MANEEKHTDRRSGKDTRDNAVRKIEGERRSGLERRKRDSSPQSKNKG